MKVFVTGAGGFLGAAIVDAAVAAGHEVLAMHRPASRAVQVPAGASVVPGDLRQTGEWTAALAQADAVIHCAAAASGDLATQLAGTVLATENLLANLPAGLRRFVHVSSFSVYDFSAGLGWGNWLDETSPLEPQPLRRDAYTQTKLRQEAMVREACHARAIPLAVIRPGAIYGPGKNWDYGRAMRAGPLDLIFAPLARMRLVHVRNCADALVAALTVPLEGEMILNLVDDEQPSHWGFHHRARSAGAAVGLGVPVPYWMVRVLGGAARLASVTFFAGRARLPEWLDLPRQQARWRPLRYRNVRAKGLLGWTGRVRLDQGLVETVRADALEPPKG